MTDMDGKAMGRVPRCKCGAYSVEVVTTRTICTVRCLRCYALLWPATAGLIPTDAAAAPPSETFR